MGVTLSTDRLSLHADTDTQPHESPYPTRLSSMLPLFSAAAPAANQSQARSTIVSLRRVRLRVSKVEWASAEWQKGGLYRVPADGKPVDARRLRGRLVQAGQFGAVGEDGNRRFGAISAHFFDIVQGRERPATGDSNQALASEPRAPGPAERNHVREDGLDAAMAQWMYANQTNSR